MISGMSCLFHGGQCHDIGTKRKGPTPPGQTEMRGDHSVGEVHSRSEQQRGRGTNYGMVGPGSFVSP